MSRRTKANQLFLPDTTAASDQTGTGTVSPALAKARDVLANRQRPRSQYYNRSRYSNDDDQAQRDLNALTGRTTSSSSNLYYLGNDLNTDDDGNHSFASSSSSSSAAGSPFASSSASASRSYAQQSTAAASSGSGVGSSSSAAGSSSHASSGGNPSASRFPPYLSGYVPYTYLGGAAAAASSSSVQAAAATAGSLSHAAAAASVRSEPSASINQGPKRKRSAAEADDEDGAQEPGNGKRKSKKAKKSRSGEQEHGSASGSTGSATRTTGDKNKKKKKKKKKKRNKHEEAKAIIRAAMGEEEDDGLAEDNDTSTKSDFEAIQSAIRYDKAGATKFSMSMGRVTEGGIYSFLMECVKKKKAARAAGNFDSTYEPKKGEGEKSVMAYFDGIAYATFFSQLPRTLIKTGQFSTFATLMTLSPIVQKDFTVLPPSNPLSVSTGAGQSQSSKLPPLTTVFTPNPLANSTQAPAGSQPPPPPPPPPSRSPTTISTFADTAAAAEADVQDHERQPPPTTALGALASGLASPPASFQDLVSSVNVNTTSRILTVRHHHHVHHGPPPVFASVAQAQATTAFAAASTSPSSTTDAPMSLDDLLGINHHSPPPPLSPPSQSDVPRPTTMVTSSTTLGLLPDMSFPSTAAMGLSHSSIIHPPPPSTSSTPSIAGLLGVDVSSPLSPTFSTMSSSSLASAGAASANMASAAATTSAAAPAIDSMAAAAATELPYVIAAGDVSVLDIPSLYTLGTKHNSTIPVCVPMWTEAPRQKLGRTPKVRTQVRKIATVMAYLFAKKCVAIGTPVRSLTQVSIQEFIAPFLEHLPDPDTSKGRSREATKEGYPIGTLFREWAEAEKTLVASGGYVEADVPAAVDSVFGFAVKKKNKRKS